jgi:hypothetical protein
MAEAKPKKRVVNFNPETEKPIFAWESRDHVAYKKSPKWYAILIGVTLILATILYFQKMWTGMALVIIAAIVFIIIGSTKPRKIKCALYQEGLVIDGKVYPFGNLKSFWMTYMGVPKARFLMRGVVGGQIAMPLENVSVDQIKLFLSKLLPEDSKRGEDLIDVVNYYLKF